uniref:Uncharacterized protein n=1 Tax=Arundo donax TaxID=35708 RepID=A0A0A9EZQ9_ARUDO
MSGDRGRRHRRRVERAVAAHVAAQRLPRCELGAAYGALVHPQLAAACGGDVVVQAQRGGHVREHGGDVRLLTGRRCCRRRWLVLHGGGGDVDCVGDDVLLVGGGGGGEAWLLVAGAVAAERLEGGEALVARLALVHVEPRPHAVRRRRRLRVLSARVPLALHHRRHRRQRRLHRRHRRRLLWRR